MCRTPLAVLFPAFFSSGSTKNRSYGESQPFSATRSMGVATASKNGGWSQLHPYGNEKSGIPMTSISSKPASDTNSEEHILSPTGKESALQGDAPGAEDGEKRQQHGNPENDTSPGLLRRLASPLGRKSLMWRAYYLVLGERKSALDGCTNGNLHLGTKLGRIPSV